MDIESPSIFQESLQSVEYSQVVVLPPDQSGAHCSICGRLFSPDNEANDQENANLCGDCKSVFVEELETSMEESRQRQALRGRRTRHSSSDSVNDRFSHQFSHLINLVRQNQYSTPLSSSEQESQLVEGDTAARMLQQINSCTTPSGSRRWWRSQSDSEGEGVDYFDSTFGESDSNVSFGGYGAFHGESDTVSFSAYGGESDVSVDGHSFLGREVFNQLDDGGYTDSDTDIDPMHAGAGLNQWDSDEEDGEWEEASEGNLVENVEAEYWNQSVLNRSRSESNGSSYWTRLLQPPENGTIVHRTIQESHTYIPNIFDNLEESSMTTYIGNTSGYLDARGFELLEQLADGSRRGAPPAAVSCRDSLPRVLVNEEHEKYGGLVCAICKELLSIGTEVNRLPCMHLYHPCCIFPWLSARNSCPLCRFELPTDDKDYEERKQNSRARIEIQDIQQDDLSGSSTDTPSDAEADEICELNNGRSEQVDMLNSDCDTGSSVTEHTRGRWFFLAAAPIVSIITLVCWFRNPQIGGTRRPRGYFQFR